MNGEPDLDKFVLEFLIVGLVTWVVTNSDAKERYVSPVLRWLKKNEQYGLYLFAIMLAISVVIIVRAHHCGWDASRFTMTASGFYCNQ